MAEMLHPPMPMSMPRRLWTTLFSDAGTALVSMLILALMVYAGVNALRWGVFESETLGDVTACRAAGGACWGALVEKGRLILLGRYPSTEQWRPIAGTLILLVCLGISALPQNFGRRGVVLVAFALVCFGVLLRGGVFGLTPVDTDLWSGLPLTLLLSVVACLFGMPIGILIALARRSKLPVLRWLATGYVELVRGLPLITLLFFGAFVLPILLPPAWRLDPMLRIAVCVVLFAAAYQAEVVRAGLQAIPAGQLEAAHALSLSKWQTLTRIVLPQALRTTIPPTASLLIGTVKDTSLVAIVNVYDLTGTLRLAQGDAQWRPYFPEMYLMVSAIYLAIGLSIASYGRYLERRYALK
ncbi:amino acid ABC transporter permease [Mesorhizobium sp. KR1-2]|uniref:amino acid ABC transporter permease n=1 Tax=Mesorhizobium sp. KR1-2 TaxID=3156609 RepID=UPI0032B5B0FC